MSTKPFRWLRTIRHFPPSALWHRLRLKFAKQFYQPAPVAEGLASQWQVFWAVSGQKQDRFMPAFEQWQYQTSPTFKAWSDQKARQLIENHQGELLNQPFALMSSVQALLEELSGQTPLWRENYGYLEFLRPLIWMLQSSNEPSDLIRQANTLLESQLTLFWELSFQHRCWSTYGVSRRLQTYVEILPVLTQLSAAVQQAFWQHVYQESCYLVSFLEWDVQGNHLIQNLMAWQSVTVVLSQLPVTQAMALHWQQTLNNLLLKVFTQQILPDGVHYERTPMYHLWVLRDLLETLVRLKAVQGAENEITDLEKIAKRMLNSGAELLHCDGQIALFGDASLPQAPPFNALLVYAQTVVNISISDFASNKSFHSFPNAGFAVFRNTVPSASFIIDCGDFAPRDLPAHAHCDLGSFEVHGENGPLIVDSGVSEYIPSLLRDYFRGTAAHNTVWFPGQEQAEIWGGFRVAEYPHFQDCQIENKSIRETEKSDPDRMADTESVPQLTVSYENYNSHYSHQRCVTHIARRFWVIEDRVKVHNASVGDCWSLLHIHPNCVIETQGEAFLVNQQLLIIPFGAKSTEWSNQAPWRGNLNLYSAGFNLAKPGQIIALAPTLERVFGWIVVPFSQQSVPQWQWQNELLTLEFPAEDLRFYFKAQPEGLRQYAPSPEF